MRFIIFGVGAVGGTLAARLFTAGYETVGIARGRQLQAIRDNGLHLATPEGEFHARFACVAAPVEIDWRADDVIILTMKSQDTLGALHALREAGVDRQPIVCAQNGVDNERLALRIFPGIYGCTVMMPATYVEPGRVSTFGTPKHGLFDIGLYTGGTDEIVSQLCEALNQSGFAAFPHEQIMQSKYGKLLMNTGNAADAALGDRPEQKRIAELAREECRKVYQAAGISYDDLGAGNARRDALLKMGEIPGAARVGSSSAQSLERGVGSIETDYLNGEVVLLGRLHGVDTPVNSMLCKLGQIMLSEGLAPGSATPQHLARAGWNG